MLYAILAVLLVVIDQLTKYLVRANISLGENITFIPGILDLTYIQNTGAAFSILEKHTWLLTLFSAIIVLVIAFMVTRGFFKGWVGLTAATLIMSGGVGNLIDRVAFKFVTDMLETTFMDFPVFNVADCCITVGVVLLFIYTLFIWDDGKKKGDAKDGTDLSSDHQ